MNEGGWIKLYRGLLDNPVVMKDAEHLAIWIFLLLNAAHEETDVIYKKSRITLKPGEVATSYRTIGSRLGIETTKVFRIINELKNETQIATRTDKQQSIISILNWQKYQESATRATTRVQHECNTSATQNKNVRNKEDIYIDSYESICEPSGSQVVVERWNQLGLSQVTKVAASSNRGKMLNARIKEYGIDKVIEAVDRIKQSKFLQGQNKNGWVITFDWFVKPNNFVKVLEGNYDDTKHSNGSLHDFLDRLDRGEVQI